MHSLLLSLLLLLLCTSLSLTEGKTAEEWKGRTIYQLLTDRFALTNGSTEPCQNIRDYCGGTFQGIINHLPYIQSLGYDAIWISPVVKNVARGFHGYWQQDLYTINPYFGTADDLKALSQALHARNMWLMVDVVANHMASVPLANVSQLVPFNDSKYYHDCTGCDNTCSINQWNPPNPVQLEHCRLSGLLDLDQDQTFVRDTLKSWIHDLVHNYSIDGLRIDTFPHVKCQFWREFVQSAGVYVVGEVASADVTWVAPWQRCDYQDQTATLSYPLYYSLRNVFASGGTMKELVTLFSQYSVLFRDPSILGTFAENHDQPRFLSQSADPAKYRSALAYTLTSQGIAIMYYGSEQGFSGRTDPNDREPLWTSNYDTSGPYFSFLATINRYRKVVSLGYQSQYWVLESDSVVAFVRGDTTLVVLTQQGSKVGNMTVPLSLLPWANGTVLTSILPPMQSYVVQENAVTVNLINGEPLILSSFKVLAKGLHQRESPAVQFA